MPTFKNQTGFTLIPDNTICQFTVAEMEATMRDKGKTNGAMEYRLKLDLHNEDGDKIGTVRQSLIDHESTDYHIDHFLRASDAVGQYGLKEGQAFEFLQSRAETKKVAWVDPVGLRGWCIIGVREYTSQKDGSMKKVNEVSRWLDDRAPLPRKVEAFE